MMVLDRSQSRERFITLKRNLLAADALPNWKTAYEEMVSFVEDMHSSLKSDVLTLGWSLDQLAEVLSMLLTIAAEFPQYRHETYVPRDGAQDQRLRFLSQTVFPQAGHLRNQVVNAAKTLLSQPVFASVSEHIRDEVFPLLDELTPQRAPERYMPFRVVLVGDLYERVLSLRVRTSDPALVGDSHQPGLLRLIYDRKYLRFGTSGVRGRWGLDFTEDRAKQVAQAICDFLKADQVPDFVGSEDLGGKTVVIGYDSRLHARSVAGWMASVALANGFRVQLADRDSPTPALVYWLTEHLPNNNQEVAALINCTASHNPPEWHGIKFNPRLGYPAPTNVTDFIASRVNEIQLLGREVPGANLGVAEEKGLLIGFDPIDGYIDYVLSSGKGDNRIAIDTERIRQHFQNDVVLIDEMHGAGRGYLARILGKIGVRFDVIHGKTDPHITGLPYANPEEPYINTLKKAVADSGAALGVATDTDADRFGIVDRNGVYFRPNQLLPMLVRYLGVDRELKGRIGATVTGSPLIEALASLMTHNRENEPDPSIAPAYVKHPFYQLKVGNQELRKGSHAFVVMVGVKYLEEIRRMNNRYEMLSELPREWRDLILVAGEESSGAIFRGHVTDKDGIFADLVIMDMMAYYGQKKRLSSVQEIWQNTCNLPGMWMSYGSGRPDDPTSNTGRVDIDAVLEAKEELISYFLDLFSQPSLNGSSKLGDFEVVFCGGVRYDLVELQLRDLEGDDRHFLRIRSSGTEPINRIYIESASPVKAQLLKQMVMDKLDELASVQIMGANSIWRLASVLVYSQPSDKLKMAVSRTLQMRGWSVSDLFDKLNAMESLVEQRNRDTVREWQLALCTPWS